MTERSPADDVLDGLYWRAEILQALYWMHGERLATEVAPAALAEFLGAEQVLVERQMRLLAADGYLEPIATPQAGASKPSPPQPPAYRLTPLGLQEGGRSFRDEFADYQRPAHGECGPGCWCQDPEHEGDPCPSEEPKHADA